MLNYDELIEGSPEARHSYCTVRMMTGLLEGEINGLAEKGVLVRVRTRNGHWRITAASLKEYVNRLERRKKPKENENLNIIAVAALLQKPSRRVREMVSEGKILPSTHMKQGTKYVFRFRELKKQPYFMDLYQRTQTPLFTPKQPEQKQDDLENARAAVNRAFALPPESPPNEVVMGPLLKRRGKILSFLTSEAVAAVFEDWAEESGFSRDYLINLTLSGHHEFQARLERRLAREEREDVD